MAGNGERQVSNLCDIEDPLPTPEELDELDPGEAIRRIEIVVENNAQLGLPLKARRWGEMAVARVKARAKANTKAVA